MNTNNCPLCGREIEGKKSKHHLIPILKGGKHGEKILLHQICHDKIHSLFDESELRSKYCTIEKLLEHEEIQKFVRWVRKKPNDFHDSSKKIKHR